MKPETLYENLNSVDEQLLERSETAKAPRRRPWWMGAVAAAWWQVVTFGAAFWPKGSPLGVEAHAIETAVYPEMAPILTKRIMWTKPQESTTTRGSTKPMTPGGNRNRPCCRKKAMPTGWIPFSRRASLCSWGERIGRTPPILP